MAKKDDNKKSNISKLTQPTGILNVFNSDKSSSSDSTDDTVSQLMQQANSSVAPSSDSDSNSSKSSQSSSTSSSSDDNDNSSVDEGLSNELEREAEDSAAQDAMMNEKLNEDEAEQGADVDIPSDTGSSASTSESSDDSSSSSSASKSSSASSVVSSSSSNSSSSSSSASSDSDQSSTVVFDGKKYPKFDIVKQIPLKDFHSFDVGLQRAYLSHQDLIKDIKQMENNPKAVSAKDYANVIKDDTKVFQNLCDTIYTNRKNFNHYMDSVSNMLQDTKDKATKGNDVIQEWKDNGIFANIEPYLKIIAKVVQDPRFQQVANQLSVQQIKPTKALTKQYTKDKQKLDQLQAQQAKQGQQGSSK